MSARKTVAVLASVALLTGACSSSFSGGASGKPAPQVHVDEKSNGKTVSVGLGGTVVVQLHSTYWSMVPQPSVLQPVGPPQVVPTTCPIPGGGCGTLTATYNAAHVGTATLRAQRTSCGEAMRCVGSEGEWSVTVRVS